MPYLDTYSGNWTAKKVRHLLKRTSFGVKETSVSEAVTLGLSATIDKLFTINSLPETPLKYDLDIADPDVNYGESWVSAPIYPDLPTSQERNKVFKSRNKSLYAWSILQMQNSGISIREKLTLFWHNHFVAENSNPHREFDYINLLRSNALGSFKELTKLITLNTNMLIYLNGNQNTEAAPNENYSRELLELFTIGKGDAVGNGDYTNYTEEDVVQMAKILTGWRTNGIQKDDALIPFFKDNKHSTGNKTLSHRFNSNIILENGENEYSDLIDKIFEQEECSKFIIRQLYSWFVNPKITTEIEANIIEPLAKNIRDNNYEITPALKILLSSDHFYENTFCMIKSPIDLMLSTTNSLLFSAPNNSILEEYEFAYILYLACSDLEQAIFHHPDVAGWKAYYQQPLYDKTWVNSYSLPKRLDYCRILVTGGKLLIDKKKYTVPPLIPVLDIAASITNSEDPNILITSLSNQLFNYEISQNQIDSLKDILIPGLPDFEWNIEYSDYIANPSDEALKNSVENKLRSLIGTMVQMSEFQIM